MSERSRPNPGAGCRRCQHLPKVHAERAVALEEARRDLGAAGELIGAQRASQALCHELLSRSLGVLHHLDDNADLLRQAAKLLQKYGQSAAKTRAQLRVRAARLAAVADEMRPVLEEAQARLGVQTIKFARHAMKARAAEGA